MRCDATRRCGRDDGAVTRVIVTANGERAFSAGGDIRALYELRARRGSKRRRCEFFRGRVVAQQFDQALSEALCLADRRHRHGRRRWHFHPWLASCRRRQICNSRCRKSASDFSRMSARPGRCRDLPGEIGTYLRADRRAAEDRRCRRGRGCHPSRASDRFARFARCAVRAVSGQRGARRFRRAAGGPGRSCRGGVPSIGSFVRGRSVEDILAASSGRRRRDRPAAMGGRKPRRHDPHQIAASLKIALAQMRRGAECIPSRNACGIEFRIVSRIVYGHDMYEGVRAVIVDKDNAPRWRRRSLRDVHR